MNKNLKKREFPLIQLVFERWFSRPKPFLALLKTYEEMFEAYTHAYKNFQNTPKRFIEEKRRDLTYG